MIFDAIQSKARNNYLAIFKLNPIQIVTNDIMRIICYINVMEGSAFIKVVYATHCVKRCFFRDISFCETIRAYSHANNVKEIIDFWWYSKDNGFYLHFLG